MDEKLKVIITAEIDGLKKGVQDAQKQIKGLGDKSKISMKDLSKGFQDAGKVAAVGLAAVGTAVVAAAGALLNLSEATKEYRTNQAKLDAAFKTAGASADTAKDVYNDLYRVLGDDGQATEAANHLAQLTTNQAELAEWTDICQGVYATFGDSLPIESLTEAANETAKTGQITGSLADALNWAGISEEEFQAKLDATATEEERAALIRETLNGKYQEAAANYEKTAESILKANEAEARHAEAMANLGAAMEPINTALTNFKAQLAEEITPVIEEIMEEHGPAIEEFLTSVAEGVGKVIDFIATHWETISTIAAVVGAIATALGVYSAAMAVANAVMAVSPITWIVLGITALIAAIALCIVHWEEISEAIGKAWDWIKEKTGEAVDAVVNWFNNMKENISNKVEEIKTNVSEKFEAVKGAISEKVETAVNAVSEKFENMRNNIKEKLELARDIVGIVFDAIKNNIQTKIETAKTVISNVLSMIKAIITGDFTAAKESAINIFEAIKKGIEDKIANARDAVKTAIDKIKGFFNFKWSLPKLKLPHIKITGKFSLDPLQVPKFSISWNKLGGVFDKPTIFGFGDSLQGIGEAGAEAVVPLENNLEWLDKLARMLDERMNGHNAPIVLQVDGKTFAQTSIKAINQLTKQTGSLGLNLI